MKTEVFMSACSLPFSEVIIESLKGLVIIESQKEEIT
jgi:hypothetical protein